MGFIEDTEPVWNWEGKYQIAVEKVAAAATRSAELCVGQHVGLPWHSAFIEEGTVHLLSDGNCQDQSNARVLVQLLSSSLLQRFFCVPLVRVTYIHFC